MFQGQSESFPSSSSLMQLLEEEEEQTQLVKKLLTRLLPTEEEDPRYMYVCGPNKSDVQNVLIIIIKKPRKKSPEFSFLQRQLLDQIWPWVDAFCLGRKKPCGPARGDGGEGGRRNETN